MSSSDKSLLSRFVGYFSPVQSAARKFRKQRAAYYEYLADMLGDSDGLMLDIFRKDAERYATKPRGVLSAYWAERFLDVGADLVTTWRGTIPDADMMLIASAAQTGGTSALPTAFREIARLTRVMDEAKSNFMSIVFTGLIALVLVVASIISIPLVIWPNLHKSFPFVAEEFLGPKAIAMRTFSEALPGYLVPVAVVVIALVMAFVWSLSNWTGRLRSLADRHIIVYRLNRDFKGAMFISTLSAMVRRRVGSGMSLRDGLASVSQQADPWLQWYCDRIMDNLAQGASDAHVFDVGLLDQEVLYYLLDMAEARSLDEGLQLAGRRTERDVAKAVKVRARILQITLLLFGLLTTMGITGWSMGTIYELVDSAKATYQQ